MKDIAIDFTPDEFGPEKVIIVYDPRTRMQGYLVIDNTARGPGKGGVRMRPDLKLADILRLARTMTWKNAASDLPLGGAKGGIAADPKDPNREAIIRAYARAIGSYIPHEYAFGLDMGLTENDAALVVDELHDRKAATGKPTSLGGIPYDELMITAFGVVESLDIACQEAKMELRGSRVVIQGCGAVGKGAARFCQDKGATVIGISDSRCALWDPEGLDIEQLLAVKKTAGCLDQAHSGKRIAWGEELFLDTDILIPCAVGDVIRKDNVDKITARIIAEGANFATTREAQQVFHERGILVVPDFIANPGGVIAAYTEMLDGTPSQAIENTRNKVRKNTAEMFRISKDENLIPLDAAMKMATERVIAAMKAKGIWKR
ncbi:MAG: Glu/Leu/Phe/Val family dehydrogenase, partial [Thermodesulfobacteriota bacterium]